MTTPNIFSTFRRRCGRRPALPIHCRAIVFPLAACLLASCADMGALLRLGGEPFVQRADNPVRDPSVPVRADASATGNPIIDLKAREDRSPAAAAAEDAPRVSPEIGVGSKRSVPLTEVRQQLARLLRRGAIDEVPDELMAEGAPANTRFFVQIGSHQLQSAANSQLGRATMSLSSVIANFDLQVRPGEISGQGRFFRVQIGPISNQGAALDLCRTLQAQKHSCFMLAEKLPEASKPKPDLALKGEWASIALGEGANRNYAGRPTKDEPAPSSAQQLADVAPAYTAPGLPGLPD
jgi:hypothetical protein